ncbi:MAG: hypothetical protein ACTTJ7_07655 [Treponema sp.]
MTTMVIEPIYSDNRSEDGAYGCSCICNVESDTHDIAADSASAIDVGCTCGCSCISSANSSANSDLAQSSGAY